MPISSPPTVPEFDVENLDVSIAFYVRTLGFRIAAERPEERFAYLVRDDLHLMLEEAAGPGRRFRTAPLEQPFGRGLNLQMRVSDLEDLYERVIAAEAEIVLAIEDRWYRQGSLERGLRQFVVADPDGYLLRFVEDRGSRAVDLGSGSAADAVSDR